MTIRASSADYRSHMNTGRGSPKGNWERNQEVQGWQSCNNKDNTLQDSHSSSSSVDLVEKVNHLQEQNRRLKNEKKQLNRQITQLTDDNRALEYKVHHFQQQLLQVYKQRTQSGIW